MKEALRGSNGRGGEGEVEELWLDLPFNQPPLLCISCVLRF